MNHDLTQLLEEWAYESGRLNVRLIQGDDGEPKIQLRLDLGILQLNTTGRPDGEQVHESESYLEYLQRVNL